MSRPAPTRPDRAQDGPPDAAAGWVGWAGVVLLTLVGALSGLVESLLVPVYAGSTPLPVTVLLAVVGNALLPRLARTLVPTTVAAALPVVGWLVVVVGFGIVARPEGDVILPGGPLTWVTYTLVLGGALAGVISVAMSAPLPTPPGGAPRRPLRGRFDH